MLELCFEAGGAVTIAAGPGLGAVLVAAFPAVVGVLHLHKFKILFPKRALFLERRGAVADLNPPHCFIGTKPCFVHIAQVFTLGDRAAAQEATVDRFQQALLAALFHPRSN